MSLLDWWRERRRFKLMKNLCKLLGHDWYYPFDNPVGMSVTLPRRRDCIRCLGATQVSHYWDSEVGNIWE